MRGRSQPVNNKSKGEAHRLNIDQEEKSNK